MKKIASGTFLISLFLFSFAIDAFAISSNDSVNTMIREQINKGRSICAAIGELIRSGTNVSDVVEGSIRAGHPACIVVRCAIEAGGRLEDVITAAFRAGASSDVIVSCAIEGGADPNAISMAIERLALPGLGYTPPPAPVAFVPAFAPSIGGGGGGRRSVSPFIP
jgi:hypothetical protein